MTNNADEARVFDLLKEGLLTIPEAVRMLPQFVELERAVEQEDALGVCEAAPLVCLTAQFKGLASKDQMMAFHALSFYLFQKHGNEWGKTGRNRELGVVRFYNKLLES